MKDITKTFYKDGLIFVPEKDVLERIYEEVMQSSGVPLSYDGSFYIYKGNQGDDWQGRNCVATIDREGTLHTTEQGLSLRQLRPIMDHMQEWDYDWHNGHKKNQAAF